MVNQVESGSSMQPRPSEKGKKLGGLRGKFATATVFLGGLTAAAAGLPSPVDAGGNSMLTTEGGGSTGEFCDNGAYVLVTNFVYAAQLLEQIASGELVIALGPAPVAAANEGDQTATVQPKTITPDEIWANLAKPAPECPVVVDPTPEPTATPKPEIIVTQQQFQDEIIKPTNRPKVNFKTASRAALQAYADNPESIPFYQEMFSPDPQLAINKCKTGYEDGKVHGDIKNAWAAREVGCTDTAYALLYEYGKTKKTQFYDAFKIFMNYVSNEKAFKFDKNYMPTILGMMDRLFTSPDFKY